MMPPREQVDKSLRLASKSYGSWALVLALLVLGVPALACAGLLERPTTWQEGRDNALLRLIDPDDYECEPSVLELWTVDKFIEIGLRDVVTLFEEGAWDWPTYYALLLNNEDSDEYIGVNGEHTRELLKRLKDNQRFWDVPSDDIGLYGMHGSVIADDAKILPAVQLYFLFMHDQRLTEAQAQAKINRVRRVVENNANLGYDHPIFTLNAFAVSVEGEDVLGNGVLIPDKIVMGDGILEFFDDIGYGINAPDFVLAHEFAHHVQFELGVFDDYDGSPEATRRTELMADAFASYYCAHARGATFQTKRIVDVFNAAFTIGDCGFEFPAHHGTPNQREAATVWGGNLAKAKTRRGHINSATTMLKLFDAQLPYLVAPDAP